MLFKEIKKYLDDGHMLVSIGDGIGARSFYDFVLSRYNTNYNYIIDSKYENLDSDNCFTIDSFLSRFSDLNKFIFVVTIGNSLISNNYIDKLRSVSECLIHHYYDFYDFSLAYGGNEFLEFGYFETHYNKSLAENAVSLLSDELSREVFLNTISCHLKQSVRNLMTGVYSDQYIPDDISLPVKNLNILNLGAYDGDTIISHFNKYGLLDKFYAVELDPSNFKKLSANFKNCHVSNQYVLLNVGASDSYEEISISFDSSMTTSLYNKNSFEKTSSAKLVPLDDIIYDNFINKIVIDIEGGELKALMGLSRMITKNKPAIAVAAYHFPYDIYEIINLLYSLNNSYRFYLRRHSNCLLDTVLYAV